jgi:acetylornithine/N-succinyldiaminopimelate aminotransferase
MVAGTHGSTFGGNPLACAVANAVLDVMLAEGFLDRVAERGQFLRARLESVAADHPDVIAEVRGMGLLAGIRLHRDSAEFIKALQGLGLVTAPAAEEVVRLLPPLTVTEEELAHGCDLISAACRETSR